jgi:hypothetical protein
MRRDAPHDTISDDHPVGYLPVDEAWLFALYREHFPDLSETSPESARILSFVLLVARHANCRGILTERDFPQETDRILRDLAS